MLSDATVKDNRLNGGANGHGGDGAGIANGGTLTVSNRVFSGNHGVETGGGITNKGPERNNL